MGHSYSNPSRIVALFLDKVMTKRFRLWLETDLSPYTTSILLAVLAMVLSLAMVSTFLHKTPSVPFVTVVLTVATALASLYDSKTLLQRLLKFTMVAVLVLVQWQAVSHDLNMQNEKARQTQQEQASREEAIRQGQAVAFARLLKEQGDVLAGLRSQLDLQTSLDHKREREFGQTMHSLRSGLELQARTVNQTTPHALLLLQDQELVGESLVKYRVANTGTGTAEATTISAMAKDVRQSGPDKWISLCDNCTVLPGDFRTGAVDIVPNGLIYELKVRVSYKDRLGEWSRNFCTLMLPSRHEGPTSPSPLIIECTPGHPLN